MDESAKHLKQGHTKQKSCLAELATLGISIPEFGRLQSAQHCAERRKSRTFASAAGAARPAELRTQSVVQTAFTRSSVRLLKLLLVCGIGLSTQPTFLPSTHSRPSFRARCRLLRHEPQRKLRHRLSGCPEGGAPLLAPLLSPELSLLMQIRVHCLPKRSLSLSPRLQPCSQAATGLLIMLHIASQEQQQAGHRWSTRLPRP